MRFLCRFFRRRFFRLWVAIFLRFRFLPEPMHAPQVGGSARHGRHLGGGGLKHLGLELLAGLEHRHELGRHQHLGAAARVAGATGAALAHLEGAEAADLEVLALAQRPADGLEQVVHDHCRMVLGDTGLARYFLNQFRFGHGVPPSLFTRRQLGRHAHGPASGPAPQHPGAVPGAGAARTANVEGRRRGFAAPQLGQARLESSAPETRSSKRLRHAAHSYSKIGIHPPERSEHNLARAGSERDPDHARSLTSSTTPTITVRTAPRPRRSTWAALLPSSATSTRSPCPASTVSSAIISRLVAAPSGFSPRTSSSFWAPSSACLMVATTSPTTRARNIQRPPAGACSRT